MQTIQRPASARARALPSAPTRRRLLALISASAALPAIRVGHAQTAPAKEETVLIVYLSRTGNTEALARLIQSRAGGTLAPLVPQKPYPLDYAAQVDQVVHENDTGFLPALLNPVDPTPYSTVFVGFPTWGMQLPPPVKSWLTQVDLSGKRVLPFNLDPAVGRARAGRHRACWQG